MIPARRSESVMRFFDVYVRRYVGRRFDRVRLWGTPQALDAPAGLPLPEFLAGEPADLIKQVALLIQIVIRGFRAAGARLGAYTQPLGKLLEAALLSAGMTAIPAF